MASRCIAKIILFSTLLFLTGNLVLAAEAEEDKYLLEEVIPHTTVQAVSDNQVITKKNAAGEVVVETINYLGLERIASPNVYINFRGTQVKPATPIYIKVKPADNFAKNTAADESGSWQIDIPLHELPIGQSLAYIQTELNNVKSKEVGIASFNVAAATSVPEQAYYWAILILSAILILFILIIVQLKRNSAELAAKRVL